MKRFWGVLPIVLALSACGGQPGGEYVGKWVRSNTSRSANPFVGGENVYVTNDTLTIERNGDGFMLRTARTFKQNDLKPTIYPEVKEPGIYKDGQLQVAGGLAAFVIDEASGHLVPPNRGGDYTRAK